MKEYLELQSTLKPESVITDVRWDNNRLYFRVDGHLFMTVGSFVYHEDNPFARSPIADIMARKHNTPEGIAEDERNAERDNQSFKDFMEYRHILYLFVFENAMNIHRVKGKKAFLQYVDRYLEILTEDEGDKLIAKIKKEKESK